MNLPIADALARLFEAEFRCPTARLDQAMPYIPWSGAGERPMLERICSEDREHLGWIAEMILRCGGSPPPASYATSSADTHYVRLESLLPMLVQAERRLLSIYQAASPSLADEPDAARLAARIVARHTQHLVTFESLKARAV